MMKRRLLSGMAAATALAASLMISTIAQPAAADPLTADAATAQRAGVTPNSAVKDLIHVDDTKNKIVATLRGVGKQVYKCGTDGKYALREPVAVLFNLRAGQAGIHGKGPFWALFDGSKVTGALKASDLPQAGPGNVAWLLLDASPELNTGGALANVTLIQRIDTRGGLAPATCTTPTVSVDYSANYVFWAPK